MSVPLPVLPDSPWSQTLDRLAALADRAGAYLDSLEAGTGTLESHRAGLEMALTQLGGQLARVENLADVEDGLQALRAARRRVPRQRDGAAPFLRPVPDVP